MNPKISVIMPVYNVEKYVERAIRSVINQTFRDIELLIVDDCGQDNSMQIAADFAKTDSRIRIFSHECNKGQGMARNMGVENAKGEYVCFVDSDDYIELDMLETVHKIAQEEAADIVVFGAQMVFNNNVKELYTSYSCNPSSNFEALQLLSTYKIGYMPWDKLYSRKFINNYNITFPQILHEDIPFAIKCAYWSAKTIVIPNVFYNYYQREDSTQNDSGIDEKYFNSYFEVVKQVSNFIGETGIHNDCPYTAKQIEKGVLLWLLDRLNKYYTFTVDESETDLLLHALCKAFGANGHFIYSMLEMLLEKTTEDQPSDNDLKEKVTHQEVADDTPTCSEHVTSNKRKITMRKLVKYAMPYGIVNKYLARKYSSRGED